MTSRLGFLKEGSPAVGDVHVNSADWTKPLRGDRTAHDIEDERRASLRSGPTGAVNKGQYQSLYVSRRVVNGAEIVAWAKKAGFRVTYPADELHVTVAFPARGGRLDGSGPKLRNRPERKS